MESIPESFIYDTKQINDFDYPIEIFTWTNDLHTPESFSSTTSKSISNLEIPYSLVNSVATNILLDEYSFQTPESYASGIFSSIYGLDIPDSFVPKFYIY